MCESFSGAEVTYPRESEACVGGMNCKIVPHDSNSQMTFFDIDRNPSPYTKGASNDPLDADIFEVSLVGFYKEYIARIPEDHPWRSREAKLQEEFKEE